MIMGILIEDAINLAVKYHMGQEDKSGAPYILHPIRVMLAGRTNDEMVVGVLHDIVEDTRMTLAKLQFTIDDPVVTGAVQAITHYPNEPNKDYLTRVLGNTIATRVKISDIHDNLLPVRMQKIEVRDRERLLKKYYASLDYLEGRTLEYVRPR